jgi:hypothetical protein
VFAVLPGWAWWSEVVTVGAGEEVALDLKAGGVGGVLRARVVDPADRPVARLPLILTTDGYRVSAGLPLLDPDSEDPVPSVRGLEAVVETDADGRFEVRGLTWRPRYAASLDGAWHVTHEGEGYLTLGEATLRARPGFVLEGLVTDAQTRKVLGGVTRSEEIRVGEEIRTTHATTGARGQFRWAQAVPDGGAAGFDVVFRASARGFRPAVRTVRFAPDRWSQRVDVALERLRPQDVGRVRLVHALRDERDRPLPLDVTVWEVHGTNRSGEAATVEYGSDGFGAVELPAGESQVRIEPQEPGVGGSVLAWEGPLEVTGSRTSDFVVPFPPAGSVLLRTTPRATGDRIVLVDAHDRRVEVQAAPDVDHVLLAAVPVGTWRAWSRDHGRESAVTVQVVAGEVAEATLRP